jgi:ribosomal protein S12 methylthiotransferase
VTLPHYAYLKIADGCNHRCAFCLIPKIKGNLHSLEREFIVREVEGLANNGVKEIIITAQDTTNYGADIYGKPMLIPLLKDLEKIKGIEWIRVLYTYPGEVTEGLVSYIKNSEKVVPYIDMPIQHINDRMLKNMNRVGQRKDIEKILELFKVNNIAVRTTLIVGFPGEGEKEFEELKEFVEKMKFDHLGVFKYFREEGTKSYNMENQVEEAVKERREEAIRSIQEKISLERNNTFIGQTIPAIIDYYDEKEGVFVGRTKYDAPEIDNIVLVKGDVIVGEIQDVVIESAKEHVLTGRVL